MVVVVSAQIPLVKFHNNNNRHNPVGKRTKCYSLINYQRLFRYCVCCHTHTYVRRIVLCSIGSTKSDTRNWCCMLSHTILLCNIGSANNPIYSWLQYNVLYLVNEDWILYNMSTGSTILANVLKQVQWPILLVGFWVMASPVCVW